jgi:hypothetical protein
MNESTRAVLCLVVGLFAGVNLGFVFAPDPTGVAPLALAVVITALVGGYLYQSSAFRDATADEV